MDGEGWTDKNYLSRYFASFHETFQILPVGTGQKRTGKLEFGQ